MSAPICTLRTCDNPTNDPSGFCHHHRDGASVTAVTAVTARDAAVQAFLMSNDPYIDQEIGVMRNLLGARTQEELDNLERRVTTSNQIELRERGLPGMYTLRHLAQFHRAIFKGCYDWAGKYRTVNISKSTDFAKASVIEEYGTEVLKEFSNDQSFWDDGTRDKDAFVARLAHHYNAVNVLHPFREGNGRTQRAFFGSAIRAAGWNIDWALITEEENISAMIAAQSGDLEPLTAIMDRCVR